uniref:Ankyrin repeat protein n=1 Tax=Rodentolepis nana TaxID=102285 RepID=A0A0R3TEQ1_RODNA
LAIVSQIIIFCWYMGPSVKIRQKEHLITFACILIGATGPNRSAFEGEIEAIRIALSQLCCLDMKFTKETRNPLKAQKKEKQWSVKLSNIADWPRIEAVAEFRLRNGHDCLAKLLYRLGVGTQPTCPYVTYSPKDNDGNPETLESKKTAYELLLIN